MSKITTDTMPCMNCGKNIEFKIYNSVNDMFDSELVEKLLNNELRIVKCSCGNSFHLDYPVLYHKMDLNKSIMIQYTKLDIEEAKKQHQLVNDMFESNKGMFMYGLMKSEEDVFEAYNDWDAFLNRVKEIY